MACSDYSALMEFWMNGQFIDGVTCFYLSSVPGPLFTLIVAAAIGLSLYVATESAVIPVVAALLIGGIFAAELPGGAINLGLIVILLVIATAGYKLVLWVERGA